jgi:uncharacterized iron-regulated membrane protein
MNMRRLHRWLGLVIFVPALLWGLSGALLAWKNWARDAAPPAESAKKEPDRPFKIDLAQALTAANAKRSDAELAAVEWRHLAGIPHYLIRYRDGQGPSLVNGETGQPIPMIDADLAQRVAATEAPRGVRVIGCTLQDRPSLLYLDGMELPVYRVALSDSSNVYVSPTTGEAYFRADRMAWLIRFSFYGLHVWNWSSGPGPHLSYLVLFAMALVLCAGSLSGAWLWWKSMRRPARKSIT